MRAAVIGGVGQVSVESVPDPAPGPSDVVIAVAGCGICGTDLHILDGEFAPSLPIVPGHEFAGEVVALGSDVNGVAAGISIGDQIAADPSLYCFQCHWCRRGRNNLCENFAAIGVTAPGAAAEYVVAPAANCVRLPEGVRPADAALIEPLSCAIKGFDTLRLRLGDHVLIYGAGTMGLINLELAKRAGAASVDVVDINPARLATAAQLGCTSAEASAAQIDRPRGWEVVIDCTGVIAAIEDGLSRVAKTGTFLQFGVAPEQATATWNPYRIYRDEITITGSMSLLHSWERAAELFCAGLLNPDVFISDRFPLDDYPRALAQFKAGQGRKVQITPPLH